MQDREVSVTEKKREENKIKGKKIYRTPRVRKDHLKNYPAFYSCFTIAIICRSWSHRIPLRFTLIDSSRCIICKHSHLEEKKIANHESGCEFKGQEQVKALQMIFMQWSNQNCINYWIQLPGKGVKFNTARQLSSCFHDLNKNKLKPLLSAQWYMTCNGMFPTFTSIWPPTL